MRWLPRLRFLVMVAICATMTAAVVAQGGAAVPKTCGSLMVNGTKYSYRVQGVECTFARSWTSKLIKQPGKLPTHQGTWTVALRGPAGWLCGADAGFPKMSLGSCQYTVHGNTTFNWARAHG